MKEYMFYIRNEQDAKKSLTHEEHLKFVKSCEVYIEKLKSKNQLIAAQPLIREGFVVKKEGGHWFQKSIADDHHVQVGYYHIRANDIDEAIAIAKENPEFEYVPSATIEVRPVKGVEVETGYVYPK